MSRSRKEIQSRKLEECRPGCYFQSGYFKGDKLKDWMTREESKGTVWIKDKMHTTPLNISLEHGQGEIALDVMRSKTRLEVKFKEPLQPVIHIFVEPNFSIREVISDIDLRNPESMRTLEALTKRWVVF